MTRMGRPRTKHRDMPPGCRLIAGRWYVDATNAHLVKVIGDLTGGKRSMFLDADKRRAREKYVRIFLRPLDQLAQAEAGTVTELVAMARLDLLPKYQSVKGRTEAERYLDQIDKEFGSRRYARSDAEASTGQFLRKLDVQRFIYQHREDRPVAANRLVNVMHGMFALASALWGKTEYDPTEGVERNIETPREQMPTEGEFAAFYEAAPEWMQCAMLLARDYVRRRGEILGLSEPDILDEGLRFARGKPRRGRAPKVIIIEWDEHLRALVDRLQAWKERMESRAGTKSIRLLVNEDGKPVTESGWNAMIARMFGRVNRARAKAGLEPLLRSQFHFHDLRAVKPSTVSRDEAQHLLAHDDPSATKVYRRGPHVIRANFQKAG